MRIRLTVSYRGARFAGWQVQPEASTVQGELQAVVARLCEHQVKVTGASRTDAGVHALGQVCHFDPPRELPLHRWQRAFERMLPEDIRVIACEHVPDDFHARFSARSKTYRYHVDPAAVASPFLSPFSWHRPRVRDIEAMRAAAVRLTGAVRQDVFAAQPEGDRKLRTIDAFELAEGRLLTFTVRSRSFMRHAVRGMVGSLLEVGYGRRSPDDIEAMARAAPGHPRMIKAPAQGLVLVRVEYEPVRSGEPAAAC
ncbi:MAG: tRNA pseudouridine(38-40) synthase TruA [Acidobacteriota bacterium]|jgi:tRNA pseudouridine38-40 synthase